MCPRDLGWGGFSHEKETPVLKVSVHLFGIVHHSIRVALENAIIFFLSYIAQGKDHCRPTSILKI